MDWIQILGYSSAVLTTLAFLPQAIKVWKNRSAEDISFPTFLMYCLGVSGWLTYGILTNDYPILIANAVTLVLACSILVYKIKSML